MIFSKFTELCNHHHSSGLEHFHHPKEVPRYPFCIHPPFSTPTPDTNLLSVSLALPFLVISYQCSHRACGLLCLAALMSIKRVGPTVSQRFTPASLSGSCAWMDHIWFIHSLADGHLECFFFLMALIKNAAVNIHTQIFLCLCFYFSWVST